MVLGTAALPREREKFATLCRSGGFTVSLFLRVRGRRREKEKHERDINFETRINRYLTSERFPA